MLRSDPCEDLERVKTIMNLIAFEPAPNTTGLCLALYRSMLDDKHAGLLQTQVMMMTLDKIWRMKVDDKIRKVIGALRGLWERYVMSSLCLCSVVYV